MKRLLFGLCAALFVTCSAAAPPERRVQGHRLVSRADPAMTITLPRSARYLGADRWDLYDICDAEVHVFVEAGANKVVKALYWIQFESYLPNNSHIYDYSRDELVTFAGRPFWKRARFGPTNEAARAGSDSEHVRQIIERAGYTLPPHMMNVRLVHLPDPSRRKELMFIYSEELTTPAPGEAWSTIEKGLIERAMTRIRPSRPD